MSGRVAVVTGVSRQSGIGFAVARHLLLAGARVLLHAWAPHDAPQPWGSDPAGVAGVVQAMGDPTGRLASIEVDFADAAAPALVIDRAVALFGHVDVLVANHARSSHQTLTDVTAEELDVSWAVNAAGHCAAHAGVRRPAR